MTLPFTGAPHVFIVRRDDWIEIETHCMWSGNIMSYTLYPDGHTLRRVLDEEGNLDELCSDNYITMTLFEAMTEIADTVTSNFSAIYDRLDHPESYSD